MDTTPPEMNLPTDEKVECKGTDVVYWTTDIKPSFNTDQCTVTDSYTVRSDSYNSGDSCTKLYMTEITAKVSLIE